MARYESQRTRFIGAAVKLRQDRGQVVAHPCSSGRWAQTIPEEPPAGAGEVSSRAIRYSVLRTGRLLREDFLQQSAFDERDADRHQRMLAAARSDVAGVFGRSLAVRVNTYIALSCARTSA